MNQDNTILIRNSQFLILGFFCFLYFRFYYFSPLVISAGRTNPVRESFFAAVCTYEKTREAQFDGCFAFAAPSGAVSSFW